MIISLADAVRRDLERDLAAANASIIALESQKRSLLATVADLQALVRLLSSNRLQVSAS